MLVKLLDSPLKERDCATICSIEKAAKFLFNTLLVLNGKQLPYIAQLIFIVDFFNTLDNPTNKQLEDLEKWFWVTTYSNYFTFYAISKQREAYNKFRSYLKGESSSILFTDNPNIRLKTAEFPKKVNAGSVRSNALILFMLKHQKDSAQNFDRKIEGMYLSYLSANIKNEDKFVLPESVLPRMKYQNLPYEKFLDIEKALSSNSVDGLQLSSMFLNDDMLKSPLKTSSAEIKDLIEKRKRLIIKAEKAFVDRLGIEYTE